MLALRVKFWVPVHFILQESVRNLFYMQAKADLLEGLLDPQDWATAAKLSALLCQADGIRFSEAALTSKCPMRMRKELEQLRLQLQLQAQQKLEKKDRDHVLSFKKRRLSKQKSVENIDSSPHIAPISLCSLSAPSSCTVTSKPCNTTDETSYTSPLSVYEKYIIRLTADTDAELPEDFLHQIAVEHGKLASLKMSAKSAKYWLLQAIQELPGYGEEVFSGVTTNENPVRCDIIVGAHGITICTGDEKKSISFSSIAAAKSFRRTFKLEYLNDHSDRKDLEIKLPKHAIAAGLYRSITERHAFYVCDKVRCVVTNQFTRDLKGTIASMFKEDTELGKRYVFDIQRTCREVHDHARRVLHERGVDITQQANSECDDIANYLPTQLGTVNAVAGASGDKLADVGANDSCVGLKLNGGCSMVGKLDLAIRDKAEREAVIERCVDTRISEAMTCKICMDRAINTMFNPCCHVMSCAECAARCNNCPNCRIKISSVVKIYLPPELRINQLQTAGPSDGSHSSVEHDSPEGSNLEVISSETSPTASSSASTATKIAATA